MLVRLFDAPDLAPTYQYEVLKQPLMVPEGRLGFRAAKAFAHCLALHVPAAGGFDAAVRLLPGGFRRLLERICASGSSSSSSAAAPADASVPDSVALVPPAGDERLFVDYRFLFIVDISGSMGFDVSPGISRLQAVKNAIKGSCGRELRVTAGTGAHSAVRAHAAR